MLCISCLSSVVGVNTKLLIEYSMNKFSLHLCSLFNILSFNVLPLFHLYTFLANGLLWHIGCIDLLGHTYLTYLPDIPGLPTCLTYKKGCFPILDIKYEMFLLFFWFWAMSEICWHFHRKRQIWDGQVMIYVHHMCNMLHVCIYAQTILNKSQD